MMAFSTIECICKFQSLIEICLVIFEISCYFMDLSNMCIGMEDLLSVDILIRNYKFNEMFKRLRIFFDFLEIDGMGIFQDCELFRASHFVKYLSSLREQAQTLLEIEGLKMTFSQSNFRNSNQCLVIFGSLVKYIQCLI